MTGDQRRLRGYTNWKQGLDAEDMVEGAYRQRGSLQVARRWRGQGGEIDLIMRDGPVTVFVEVKRARDFDTALQRITQRQLDRIWRTAEEYLDTEPLGSLTECRFDVALVDGAGRIRVIENAIAA